MTHPINIHQQNVLSGASSSIQICSKNLKKGACLKTTEIDPGQLSKKAKDRISLDFFQTLLDIGDQEMAMAYLEGKMKETSLSKSFLNKIWDLICKTRPSWIASSLKFLPATEKLLQFCFCSAGYDLLNLEDLKKIVIAAQRKITPDHFLNIATDEAPSSIDLIEWCVKNRYLDPLEKSSKEEMTLVHVAAGSNNLELLKRMPSELLATMVEDEHGNTPLHYAIDNEHLDVIDYLIEQGADYNYHTDTSSASPAISVLSNKQGLISRFFKAVTKDNPIDLSNYNGKFYFSFSLALRNAIEPIAPFREIFFRKLLASAFALKGTTQIGLLKDSYEGNNREFVNPRVFSTLQNFLLKKEISLNLSDLKNGMNLTPSEQEKMIQEGQPLIVSACSKEHQTYLVFYQNLCYKCDRGDEDRSGIEVYEVAKPENRLNVLTELQEKEYSTELDDYFVNGINQDLELQHQKTIPHKPQKVGNCVLASLKTAIHAIFIIESLKTGSTEAQAYKLYKEFTAFFRFHLISTYQKFAPLEHRDLSLLERISRKVSHPKALKGVFQGRSFLRPKMVQLIGKMIPSN